MHGLLLYPLYASVAYLVAMFSFFALHLLIPSISIFGFIARCMSAYLSLIACAAYGTTASCVLKPFGLQFKYAQWTTARAFKWVCRYTTGVDFEILDNGRHLLDSRRPVVIVVNHQSELDIMLLGWIWPKHCSVTSKKSLKKIPFLGWFMTLSGSVFIDRADRSQAMKAFEGAAKLMKGIGQSVLMFPEGTRSYSAEPMLLPFKKGAFHLAVQAGVPILPVVAENYSKVLDVKAKRFNSGTIRVKVLDPIETNTMTTRDVNGLCDDTRNKMLAALQGMAEDKESRSMKAKTK